MGRVTCYDVTIHSKFQFGNNAINFRIRVS
jgi:hypothetical protein